MTLANPLALTLLAAACSCPPRLVPLALLLLATRCEAAGTLCDNSVYCSAGSGCPTGVHGTSLCDGTFTGTVGSLSYEGLSGTIPPQLGDISQLEYLDLYGNRLSGTVPPLLSDISQLKGLFLVGNSISGTVPPEMSKLSQLESLYLYGNRLSGTVPPQLGDISQLEILDLYSNSISGTVPAQLGDISGLKSLWLANNRLSGTIPAQLGDISGLKTLELDNNYLSGAIPAQLGDISGLKTLLLDNNYLSGALPAQLESLASLTLLDLSNNRLAYPRSSEARDEYNLATRICRGAGSIVCYGVPPDGCSAFADAQQLVTDPNKCVVCDDQTAGLVLVGVCILIGIIALAAFVRFVVRHPAALKRWVSTAAILINHAQTASIIASMRLEWPRSLLAIASALKLNLLMLPSASCLVGGEDASTFDTYAASAFSAMLLLLLAPIFVKHVALCRRRLDIADTAELVLSLIYSLLFTFAWSFVLDSLANVDSYFDPEFAREAAEFYGKDVDEYPPALFTAPVLGALLLVLLIRFFGSVLAFKRGVNSGLWRRPANPCFACRSSERSQSFGRPIPPRRLERQVAYLVGRFARHAPRWQIVIWLRQLLLLLLAFTSDVVFATAEETLDAVRYAIAAVAIAVTLVFWRLHRRALPFAFRFQNALESCLYGATALFLALAMVYTALPANPVALRVSVEALMATVLLSSLIVGAVFSIRQLRRMRRALASVDLSAILSAADTKIDGSIADRLRDGSVRLLRCSWLASPASDAFLGRDASGAVVVKRRQDMPAEAFVPCDEAVAMLERGDRSVLALSYGWLAALHPDPHGTTLAAVRRYIAADEAGDTGLFWDFASLPQKGLNGEDKTEEEKAIFGRGLKVMGNFYASITGTSVIQQRSIDLPPGATTGFGPGEYNPTPYEGEGGRGWCIFEQGTAMTVLAHLTAAERQAGEEGKALPERFRRAQAARAKVYDIGGEAPVARECSLPPKQVLDEACRAIENARFTGKADQVMVPQMLAEFEWTFRSTFEEALGDHATSGATLPLPASWAVGSIELASELGLHSSGHV